MHADNNTNSPKTETSRSANNMSMSWLVSLEAALGEPGNWMRPFETWLVRGRSIVKDSCASCFLLSLWRQWVPNMRRLGFYHTLSPNPPCICTRICWDCLLWEGGVTRMLSRSVFYKQIYRYEVKQKKIYSVEFVTVRCSFCSVEYASIYNV